MKKILLLGGSAQQVIAIETAKKLGYYTILCDYLSDNPGQYYADKFYQESTTDKEKILSISKMEKIDGIIAYASDPAAPTAAYVAEKLDLPTNPYKSVVTLCNKDKFRLFLQENGFNAPVSKSYSNRDCFQDLDMFTFPVIIKPVDSSGSKGVTILNDWEGIEQAIEFALSFSKSGRYIVEEFIEKKHDYLIGGDIFVIDGRIMLWGLMNCHRDRSVNPLVPVGKSYPLAIDETDEERVKECLQAIVDKLNIKNGAMNVEMIVDCFGRVWPIDIGPRNGGNMIPDLLEYIFGVNVVGMTIKAAMGERVNISIGQGVKYYATHNLHSNRCGLFDGIDFSPDLECHIIRKNIYKGPGDAVDCFDNAAKAIGIIFMRYKSMDEMLEILDDINEKIHIRMK